MTDRGEQDPSQYVLVDVSGLNHEHLRGLARQRRKSGVVARAVQRVGEALEAAARQHKN